MCVSIYISKHEGIKNTDKNQFMRAIRNILGFNIRESSVRNIMSQSDKSPAFSKPRVVLKKVLAKNVNHGGRLMVNKNIAR